jgi:LmbE family N-acetylglucosaminyl deacetylase
MTKNTHKYMVFAAHPDDEILGCGATMAKLAAQGHEIHIVILGEGATARSERRDTAKHRNDLMHLSKAAQKAAKTVGAKSVVLHDFPDNRMDSVPLLDVIKVVETELARVKPDTVLTHFRGDLNVDHRVVHDAVITACRPMPDHFVKTVLFFEVPSNTEWRPLDNNLNFYPNWFEDIDEFLKIKLKALQAYDSEMRPWPHPRSYQAVETLAHWRGSNVGLNAAEAFQLARLIR